MRGVRRGGCLSLLTGESVRPATVHVLMLHAVVRTNHSISLLSLRAVLSAISGSAVFHALALFLSRRLVRDVSSKANSFGCTIYDSDYSYSMDSLRARFRYRGYGGAFYFAGVPAPIIGLPRKFALGDVGCMLGNVYPSYTTRIGQRT